MARLAAYAMREPTFARIAATRTAAVGERMLGNHNKLLASLEGCTGLKTGYTDNAGRTLVTCCERDGMRLIAVTLNDRSDWADHAALYEYGFAAFSRKRALTRGEEYTLAPVRGGTDRSAHGGAGGRRADRFHGRKRARAGAARMRGAGRGGRKKAEPVRAAV